MLAGLAEERSAAHADLVEALESDRYRLLVSRLGRELASLRVSLPGEPVGELAAAEFAKLRRVRRKLGEQPADVALHDLRLRVKRARYAAELAEDEVGAAASLFVRRAKAVQDLLGEHQDATTAEARLRQALRRPQSVRYALAAGRLIERQHLRRAEVRAGFPAAWSALEKQGRATWRKHPRGA
jgi:CHAD domain-containing protein